MSFVSPKSLGLAAGTIARGDSMIVSLITLNLHVTAMRVSIAVTQTSPSPWAM